MSDGGQKSFKRRFYVKETLQKIKELHARPEFNYLKTDVISGKIYPALRENEIHFYYAGARLCRYHADKFMWHDDTTQPCNNLNEYRAIKTKCEEWSLRKGKTLWKGKTLNERAELSALYSAYSPYSGRNNAAFILLDIEIGFSHLALKKDETYGNVNIDLLFLDIESSKLYFIEAKKIIDKRLKKQMRDRESLGELYNRLGISYQLLKYEKNLKHRELDILDAYTDYCGIMRNIFGSDISLPMPEVLKPEGLALHPRPKLFIYGKNPDHIDGEWFEAIKNRLGTDLIVTANVEDISKADIVRC